VCWANAPGISNSEKFFIRQQSNGRIALQTLNGRFLSVQSGK
jgi:hypothetical protein